MSQILNPLGQPIGFPLTDWQTPPWPSRELMPGHYCHLESLDPERHARDLYSAYTADTEDRMWTYLPYGPFESFASFQAWLRENGASQDPLFYAIVERSSGQAAGLAAYLRIAPASGSIEVGHVLFSPRVQRTAVATEAMYLMMQRAFQQGYRRYEWKCDSLHAKSRAAAQRFGFSFEGIFRQATVYKGRTRDTAWYSVIDCDWPALQKAYARWLGPLNFDHDGKQRLRLADLTAPLLSTRG